MPQESDLVLQTTLKGFGTCLCGKGTDQRWQWVSGKRFFSACSESCAIQIVQNLKDCQLAWDSSWMISQMEKV